MNRKLLALGAALCMAGLGSASAGRIAPGLQKKLNQNPTGQVEVIVRFKISKTKEGRALFQSLRAQLKSALQGLGPLAGPINQLIQSNLRGAELWLDGSIVVKTSPLLVQALAQLPSVDVVFENFPVKLPKAQAFSEASAPAGTPWHLQKIGAPQLWAAGYKGQGVRIGHLDTGLDPNSPELAGKIAAFAEFNDSGERVSGAQPHDTAQHGTHTAGLLVGKTVGVAPDAKLLSALVLPGGEGTFAQVIAGMQWMLDPDNNADTNDGANVVSMSLGLPGTYQEFVQPVKNMIAAGVIPVFAIGNFGPNAGSTASPGNIPDVIGVGAVDQQNNVAPYSSRGPVNWTGGYSGSFVKPDLVAPGDKITSSFPGGGYGALSGTSQAAPIVAGAVADLLSAKPGTAISAIKNALYSSAQHLGSGGKNNTSGYGLLDLPGAAQALGVQVAQPPQPAPQPQPQPKPQPAPQPQPKPQPAPQPPSGPSGFAFCVLENQRCEFQGVKDMAYGAGGKFNYRQGHDGLTCNNANFGDPYPHKQKACFIRDVAASQPQPTPPPQPAPAPQLGAKPTLLLVDDDGGSGADVTANLRDVLRANASSPLRWDVQSQGPVPLSQLQRAEVVIWATGEAYQNTISAEDQNTLRQYLAGGGRLLVTGQDVGYDIGGSAFYRDVLSSQFVADSSGTTQVTLSGPLGGGGLTLNAPGSAGDQVYPDVLAPLGGAQLAASYGAGGATAGTLQTQSIGDDRNGARQNKKVADARGQVEKGKAPKQGKGQPTKQPKVRAQSAGALAGAIVLNDAGKYRTITLGFGLEGLAPQQRDQLVKAALAWLTR